MLCANQQQISQVWPFLLRHPLVLVDWLPWSHTFGGNHNFNMVLSHGGTHVHRRGPAGAGTDRAQPAQPAGRASPISTSTCRAASTCCCRSWSRTSEAARDVFQNMEGIFYAAAALPQSLWQRLEAVVGKVRERPVWFTSAWGATETSPA